MDALKGFYDGLDGDEVLLFTTFTLDEAMLVALLEDNHIPKAQRIVVFHDIMRHRSPGVLKAYYPNAMVYTVELNQNHPRRCPVFHSKLWARVTRSTIHSLAITSANLSQYHLAARAGSGTLESFQRFDGCKLPLSDAGPLFSSDLLFPKDALLAKGLMRLEMQPHSLVIDARKRINISATDTPLINDIRALGRPEECAAPFVCDGAIREHLNPPEKFKVYEGINKGYLSLHAKVMLFPDCMALGSVNWTAQAMGCVGKSVNHETLLITRRDKSVISAMHGFVSRPLGSVGLETPADQDMEEPIQDDWLAERSGRLDAPEQALFSIENGRARIELRGKHKKVAWVRLQRTDTGNTLHMKIRGKIIEEPVKEQENRMFAEILASGGVTLAGLTKVSSEPLWTIELNYQQYWQTFEQIKQLGNGSAPPGNGRSSKDKRSIHYLDVRDTRQRVIQNPAAANEFVAFNRWLYERGLSTAQVPLWCLTLAEKLRE